MTTETDWRAEPIPTLPGLWRVVGKGQTICSGIEEWQAKLTAAAPAYEELLRFLAEDNDAAGGLARAALTKAGRAPQ